MQNTEKFTGRANGYSKYRPRYADACIDYLIDATGVKTSGTVADIGSGTGILTEQFLERGIRVLAVEPNADMRAVAERQLIQYPEFTSIAGTAENTALESGSVALAVAGQAFHWFDRELFRVECRRILREGAKVALIWNVRDDSSELVRQIEGICARHCPAFVGNSGGIFRDPGVFTGFFCGGVYAYRTFQNDAHYELEGFIGRQLSCSYAPDKGEAHHEGFVRDLKALFDRYAENGCITVPSHTFSYLGAV